MSTVTIILKQPFSQLMEVGDKTITLNGWNSQNSMYIDGGLSKVGVTSGVPKDLWDAWREKFKNHDLFVNSLVYANESEAKAKSEAKEKAKEKSGLEALNREDLDKQGQKDQG